MTAIALKEILFQDIILLFRRNQMTKKSDEDFGRKTKDIIEKIIARVIIIACAGALLYTVNILLNYKSNTKEIIRMISTNAEKINCIEKRIEIGENKSEIKKEEDNKFQIKVLEKLAYISGKFEK